MGFICWNVVLEVGGPEEADLQRAQLPGSKGWIRKEIEKAIRKIERRK